MKNTTRKSRKMKLAITGLKVVARATRQGEPWLYAELRDLSRSEGQVIEMGPLESCIQTVVHRGAKSVQIDLAGLSKKELARLE